jgi:hypothetical protein
MYFSYIKKMGQSLQILTKLVGHLFYDTNTVVLKKRNLPHDTFKHNKWPSLFEIDIFKIF